MFRVTGFGALEPSKKPVVRKDGKQSEAKHHDFISDSHRLLPKESRRRLARHPSDDQASVKLFAVRRD